MEGARPEFGARLVEAAQRLIAPGVDRMQYELRAHLLQPPRQVRVRHCGPAGCGPEIIADEDPEAEVAPVERAQRALHIVPHLAGPGALQGAASQNLGMVAQVLALGRVYPDLVVAVLNTLLELLEAGPQRQTDTGIAGGGPQALHGGRHFLPVESRMVPGERPLRRKQEVRLIRGGPLDPLQDSPLVLAHAPAHRHLEAGQTHHSTHGDYSFSSRLRMHSPLAGEPPALRTIRAGGSAVCRSMPPRPTDDP